MAIFEASEDRGFFADSKFTQCVGEGGRQMNAHNAALWPSLAHNTNYVWRRAKGDDPDCTLVEELHSTGCPQQKERNKAGLDFLYFLYG